MVQRIIVKQKSALVSISVTEKAMLEITYIHITQKRKEVRASTLSFLRMNYCAGYAPVLAGLARIAL